MSTFHPAKLSVEYMDGTTALNPIILRRYTLTHSDLTGDLFLHVGNRYAWEKVTHLRDEVLGEWVEYGDSLFFYIYVYIDEGQFSPSTSAKRNEIFRRELPVALKAIRYGDRFFFNTYPPLDEAPIIIHFLSHHPEFSTQENWGNFQNFTI